MKRSRSESKAINSNTNDRSHVDDFPLTIRALMGPAARIYSLFDFCSEFAPSLPIAVPTNDTPVKLRLLHTLVCPNRPLKPSISSKVRCDESLSSLVNDVVWNLVQRRARGQRNVLSQGYVLASEQLSQSLDIQPCRDMRPGVLCTGMNDLVRFCKTSVYAQTLHRLVGDEVLRTLLMETTMFVPVEQDWSFRKENFLLLCGPPLQAKRITTKRIREDEQKPKGDETATNQKHERRRRKRKRPKKSTTQPTISTQASSKPFQANAIIPRASLFYSNAFTPKVGLTSNHILNQQPQKYQSLLLNMLGVDNKKFNGWKPIRDLGVPIMMKIFRRHSTCDYHRLLNRYCPLPDFCQSSDTSVTLPQVAAAYSSSNGVVSFLRAVLGHVFPSNFWGSKHNFQQVLHVTQLFVHLRRQEQLPLKLVMNGIRIKDMVWLYGNKKWTKSLFEAATRRTCNVMKWLFGQFIIPLLRTIFYVTESEFSAKKVLYYRKPVWSIFRSLSMKKLLQCQFAEIPTSEAASLIQQQDFGISRLRLLPKSTGVRALALLSKCEYPSVETDSVSGSSTPSSDGDESGEPPAKRQKLCNLRPSRQDETFKSTNAILRIVFQVLRYESGRHSDLFGSGVFGLNEVYPEYKKFMEAFRSLESASLYFASVDIQQCYDSIVQDHLLELLPKLLEEEEYLIQNSAVMHRFESAGRIVRKPLKRVGAPEEYTSFPDMAESLAHDYSMSVFMDSGGSSLVNRKEVKELLRQHLLQHVVAVRGRYGDRFLLQKIGIPQGSILSTLLCNYYYGDVESTLLSNVVGGKTTVGGAARLFKNDNHVSLLVRIVDDFLLVTTNKALSNKFLTTMNGGSDELGVRINKDKTLVSYPVTLKNADGNDEVAPCPTNNNGSGERPAFPWCGMLFDTITGETSVDYSRFANGNAEDALTIDRSGSEGRQLEIRMKTFVRPRCQPILFDRRLNSATTVAINFCQAILLCALKTLVYVQGMEGGIQRNADFIVQSMDDVISFAHKLIVDRLKHDKGSLGSTQDSLVPLLKRDAMWLGRKAFLAVFHGVAGCNEIVSSLVAKCACKGTHPMQDVVDKAIRQFQAQITLER